MGTFFKNLKATGESLIQAWANGLVNETTIDQDIMTYDDVTIYFVKQKNLIPNAAKCIVTVDKEKNIRQDSDSDKLLFIQMMLDEEEKPIEKSANSYYGRTLYINGIDDELKTFLNQNTFRIMK